MTIRKLSQETSFIQPTSLPENVAKNNWSGRTIEKSDSFTLVKISGIYAIAVMWLFFKKF
ncbi:MAG: hypothetical protein JWO53_429, partial [Chlamydiia bacterium]|nr:hypothetical protein [Chlamydiia bacterium]